MPDFQTLLYDIDAEGVATVTLNRPDALNALSRRLVGELGAAFRQARADDAVRGVILTGSGEKAFAAGADISEFADMDPLAAHRFALTGQAVFSSIEQMAKPVVAAVNGFALGGGCELAMACHLRVASDTAQFGQPEVNLGLIAGYGGTQRLPRVVGEARALEMIMTGRTVAAEEAARIGLVNRLVEGDPVEAAIAFAREFSGYGLPALAFAREAVSRALDTPIHEGLRIEADLSTLAFSTRDAAEGMAAFSEKRKAEFRDE